MLNREEEIEKPLALGEREYRELMTLHQQLTQEIQHYERYSLQIVGVIFVLITATMTIAVSQVDNPTGVSRTGATLFLAAAFAAAAGMFLSFNREANIMMNASYLRNIVEPHLTRLKWERDVQRFREKTVAGPQNSTLIQLLIFMILMIVNSALAAWRFYSDYGTVIGIIASVLLFTLLLLGTYGALRHYLKYIVNHKVTFDSVWSEVQEEYYGRSSSWHVEADRDVSERQSPS